jgi:hypothetical protein
VTPLERLLAATERLLDDAATAVASAVDLWSADEDGNGTPNTVNEMMHLAKTATEAFTVGTQTDCVQADTGTKGEVTVQVPVATYPLPLTACHAMSIVPGTLPGAPATPVSCPTHVPSGDAVVNVGVSATQAPGLYVGHVADQSGNMKRPFVIFLDGLT